MDALPSNAVPAVAPPVAAGTDAQLRKAAQDFEATALAELFKPMFDTVDMSNSLFGGGEAEESWRPILVQEMCKSIAAKGGLGLAGPVYQQLLKMQEQGPNPSTKNTSTKKKGHYA